MAEQYAPLEVRLGPAAARAAALRAQAETTQATIEEPPSAPAGDLVRVHADATEFYLSHRARSKWVPGYLARRGFSPATQQPWSIGYAPKGWTHLTDHLRHLGYSDEVIQASGLGFQTKHGNLVDTFRNRLMLPIRDENGDVVAFLGRAEPNSADEQKAKYLNSHGTPIYQKSSVLFGLAEAKADLAAGARPVLVEGPFDAIAISTADPRRYAGLALCGTAFTSRQAAALARNAPLARLGAVVALDGDDAGQRAMVRAYHVLTAVTDQTYGVVIPAGRDPAKLLETVGPQALIQGLEMRVRPLADVVTRVHLADLARQFRDGWTFDGADWLETTAGHLTALSTTATLIAGMPPRDVARQVAMLARHLQLDHPQVTEAVVHALSQAEDAPKRLARWSNDRSSRGPAPAGRPVTAAARAALGFPTSPGHRLMHSPGGSLVASGTLGASGPSKGHESER